MITYQICDLFFILIGNYLFRYSSPSSEKPKGVPIPIDSATYTILSDGSYCFEIYTLRKTYTFRAQTMEDCQSWVTALKTRKQLAIKEQLGHATVNANVEMVNVVGASLFDERLRRDLQASVTNPMMN